MKMRDAAGVLRTVSAIHMRDAANVLRTVPAVHMRDAANVLKSAYSSGPPPAVSITPAEWFTASSSNFANTSNFTASFGGASPTSIVWSIEGLHNADATIFSGQGTPTVSVHLVTNDSGGLEADGWCTIRCTAVIAGITYSATAFKEHDFNYGGAGGGGGGGGGPIP